MQQQTILPDVITCNALISACDKGNQPERGLRVFQTVQQQTILPNVITYNALISTSEKINKAAGALELLGTV